MKIISNPKEANFFLHDFATSLQRDFYAWNAWSVLQIAPRDKDTHMDGVMQAYIMSCVNSYINKGEGAVISLENGNTIVLLKNYGMFSAQDFEKQLNHQRRLHVPEQTVTMVDAKVDCKKVLEWIAPNIDPMTAFFERTAFQQNAFHTIMPEIGNIAKAWAVNCKERKNRRKPHLMIIDDDPVTRYVVGHAVKGAYPLVTAANSAEAYRKHFLLGPDIVFLDIELPDGNGFDILQHIHGYDPQCRIIMFSSNSYMENKIKAHQQGAVGFIDKPFNRKHFDHYIDEWKQERAKHIVAGLAQ